MDGEILIKADDLRKEYSTGVAVDNVNFSIYKGRIYGLIGPNGAGKTSIMKMLGGLVIPTAGTITTYRDGEEIEPEDARRSMSFMIESPYLRGDYNAWDNLRKHALLRGIKDKNRIEEVLEDVGLSDVPSKKRVRNYSLGMRQRLGIAVALLAAPDLMVLDEPTNGLDPQGIVEMRELLLTLNRERNMTIIISSHILSELSKLCSDYMFIHHGKMVKCLTDEELRNATGCDLLLHTNDDDMAEKTLRETLHFTDYKRGASDIRLFGAATRTEEIAREVIAAGLVPLHISEDEANLENYYMSLLERA